MAVVGKAASDKCFRGLFLSAILRELLRDGMVMLWDKVIGEVDLHRDLNA